MHTAHVHRGDLVCVGRRSDTRCLVCFLCVLCPYVEPTSLMPKTYTNQNNILLQQMGACVDPSGTPHNSCSAPNEELETSRGEAPDPGHTPVDLPGTPSAAPSVTCTRQRHRLPPPWSRSSLWGSARSASGLPHFWHPGLQCRLPRGQTTHTGGLWRHRLRQCPRSSGPHFPWRRMKRGSAASGGPGRGGRVGPYVPGTKHDGIFTP